MASDNDNWQRLIGAAFDALPEPDASRLKAVAEQLVFSPAPRPTKRRSAGWYWWLLAALVASGAAAWWGGEYFRSLAPISNSSAPAETEPSAHDAPAAEPRGALPTADSDKRARDPIPIYRRERY